MLTTKNWGYSSKLATSLPLGENEVRLPATDLSHFQVNAGEHYYLTIRQPGRIEVVQVTSSLNGRLQVVRAQDNTQAQYWAAGSCVEVEWNPLQLKEFLEQIGRGTPPSGVNPGTYCLDCTTCLTVNGAGQITRVDGAGGCP